MKSLSVYKLITNGHLETCFGGVQLVQGVIQYEKARYQFSIYRSVDMLLHIQPIFVER